MRTKRMTALTAAIFAGPAARLTVDDQPPANQAETGGAPSTPAPKVTKKAKAPKAAKKPAKAAPKKAAKKAKKSSGSTKTIEQSTEALREAGKEYQRPKGVKTAGGNQAVDNGDKVAKALRGLSLGDVYKKAASALKEPESALRAKYKHLNEGMQRMNLGNRMRAAG